MDGLSLRPRLSDRCFAREEREEFLCMCQADEVIDVVIQVSFLMAHLIVRE
jgi:hypothetical protein